MMPFPCAGVLWWRRWRWRALLTCHSQPGERCFLLQVGAAELARCVPNTQNACQIPLQQVMADLKMCAAAAAVAAVLYSVQILRMACVKTRP